MLVNGTQQRLVLGKKRKTLRMVSLAGSLARLRKTLDFLKKNPLQVEELMTADGKTLDKRKFLEFCQFLNPKVELGLLWDDPNNQDIQVLLAYGYRIILEHLSPVNRKIFRRLRDIAIQNGKNTLNWFEFYAQPVSEAGDQFLSPQYELNFDLLEQMICHRIWK